MKITLSIVEMFLVPQVHLKRMLFTGYLQHDGFYLHLTVVLVA